ncbi:hypothetical protein KR026_000273, partial [Drosophila bipectinata]
TEDNLWQLTSHIKRPKKRVALIRKPDGEWCRSDQERADVFAAHLEDAFTPFNRCSEVDQAETERFLSLPRTDFCQLEPVSKEEVQEEVAGLNTKKSPAADGLKALAIKLLPPLGIQRLTSIFNACLEIGHFPSDWKKVEVILIPKPGKPEADLASYRPISLLSAGVPQGSVLGPILYTIYTADMPVAEEEGLLVATYEDDTAFLTSAIFPEEASASLQRQLDILDPWLRRWNIAVNHEESGQTTFT